MWFHNIFSTNRPDPASPALPIAPSPQLLRQLDRLRLDTGQLLLANPSGSRSSQLRKPASEFRDHRQYAPGDDIRYVDWKASARQEHIFIKQGETQKAALVYILLDCSASMAWGDPPKTQAALALANVLGYLALAHNDRLLILPVTDGASRPFGPLWGKGQAPLLGRYFQSLGFQGQIDLTRTLASLSRQKLSQGGLVLVISDLFGTAGALGWQNALDAVPAPAWKVVICHLLHPAEINPELHGNFELQDIETGQKKLYTITAKALNSYRQRLQNWQNEIAGICRERNVVYTLLPTNASLENEIVPQLRRDQVVKTL